MFGRGKLNNRLEQLEAVYSSLEARVTTALQERADELTNVLASELESRVKELNKGELLRYFRTELDPKVRAWAYEAVQEAARNNTKCEHNIGQKVMMRVSVYRSNITKVKSGGLIETDAKGNVTYAATYYGQWNNDDHHYLSIYMRKCRVCGWVEGVDASDIAMAGKSLLDCNISTIGEIRKIEPVPYVSHERAETGALDSLLDGN